jgi:hypothetical protein
MEPKWLQPYCYALNDKSNSNINRLPSPTYLPIGPCRALCSEYLACWDKFSLLVDAITCEPPNFQQRENMYDMHPFIEATTFGSDAISHAGWQGNTSLRTSPWPVGRGCLLTEPTQTPTLLPQGSSPVLARKKCKNDAYDFIASALELRLCAIMLHMATGQLTRMRIGWAEEAHNGIQLLVGCVFSPVHHPCRSPPRALV